MYKEEIFLFFMQNWHGRKTKKDMYSRPLCHKIIKDLLNRPENFHLRLFFVLGHNTKTDLYGHQLPIFSGLLVC
jgi:Protein N-terminal asparagine amidohydrolase